MSVGTGTLLASTVSSSVPFVSSVATGLSLVPVTVMVTVATLLTPPSLSVAIFAQNGVYGLFAATFAPVVFGLFTERATAKLAATAAIAALIVHFGMYYGGITHYHNNRNAPITLVNDMKILLAKRRKKAFQKRIKEIAHSIV